MKKVINKKDKVSLKTSPHNSSAHSKLIHSLSERICFNLVPYIRRMFVNELSDLDFVFNIDRLADVAPLFHFT